MINWNNWSNNKLQIRRVLYYFDYNWPRWPLKFVFFQGWLGPTKIGDLPPAERFSNNLNISNQRQPDISAQNEKSDFSRGIQDILTNRVYDSTSCQEKHLSFHFLKGKTRTIKIPPSFGCFASPKMHKMHVRCKDTSFLCNFLANFHSSKWLNANSEEPHCCKFKKPKGES